MQEDDKSPNLKLIDEIIVALEPIKEGGNLWATGWSLRLMMASAFQSQNEEVLGEILAEFRASLGELFKIVASMYKTMMEWGLVPDPEEAEEHGS